MATRPRIRFRKPRTPRPEADGTSATALQAPPAAAPRQPPGTRGPASQPAPPGQPVASGAVARPQAPAGLQGPAPDAARPAAAPEAKPAIPSGASPATDATAGAEPLAGIRAWLAQLDRKLGTRTYIGLALAVLALAAAGAALYLTLSLKQDAATKADVNALRDQVSGVQRSATQAAEDSVKSLNQRLAQLESDVGKLTAGQKTTKRELSVVEDDIRQLRSQAAGGTTSGSGFGGTGASPANPLGSGGGNGGVGP